MSENGERIFAEERPFIPSADVEFPLKSELRRSPVGQECRLQPKVFCMWHG